MRRRRMSFRSGRKRRATDWIVSAQGLVIDPLPSSGTTFSVSLINDIDLDDHDDEFTVIRVVGQVHFWGATTGRVDAFAPPIARGHQGICKVETDSAGASIDLVPDDGIDGDSEAWLWRDSWISPREAILVSPDSANALTSSGWNWYHTTQLDLRVMRKMHGREQLLYMYRVFHNLQGPEYQALFQLRTLVKLV